MSRLKYFLLLQIILCGCEQPRITTNAPEVGAFVTTNLEIVPFVELRLKVKTVVYDGCEYLFIENGRPGPGMSDYAMSWTHKGNCTNRIHQRVIAY
jgi:hypothetical protein